MAVLVCVVGCRAPAPPHITNLAFLEQYARTHRFTLGQPRSISVVADGSAVLFLRSGGDSLVQDLYEFDTATGTERVLLTAEQILQGAEEHLSVEERARRERMRLSARGIASYELSTDGRRILVPLSGRLFVVERAEGRVSELVSTFGYPLDARLSPDGNYVSCVRDGELYVTDVASAHEQRLTFDADENVTNGLAEFVAQEEMGRRRGYWWSPDGDLLACQRTDTSGVERMHILDAMNPQKPAQSWPYPRAGTDNAIVTLRLVPYRPGGGAGETTWVEWDRDRYPYLATVKWPENGPLTLLVQNRAQTEEVLLAVETTTGRTTPLLRETDEAWLNLDSRMPHWFPDGSAFFWTTERNGAWQLEVRGADGELCNTVTGLDFRFKQFVHFDETDGVVYVSGSEDPSQTHLYVVSLPATECDGLRGAAVGAPVRLTTEPGLHGAKFGKGHAVFVHSFSTLSGERANIVRNKDGKEIGRLRSVGQEPPYRPRLELTTVESSPTFHCAVIRPRDFSLLRRYPVIVYVYGGPHAQVVQSSLNGYLLQQWIADQGFIVVAIDGRGTPSRGRDWERVTKGNLIDIPLEDQVAALRALGDRYPELDLDRVGIYGWSFGGYFSAMAAMRRPDVFDAAVAGAPVADWRDYDTHYTERYMGLPDENGEGYARASALTYADRLTVPLLIVHGTADDNVYFMHSLKLSNALFRAGRPHEILVLSDFTHMVHDPVVTTRLYTRMVSFFAEHLRR